MSCLLAKVTSQLSVTIDRSPHNRRGTVRDNIHLMVFYEESISPNSCSFFVLFFVP